MRDNAIPPTGLGQRDMHLDHTSLRKSSLIPTRGEIELTVHWKSRT